MTRTTTQEWSHLAIPLPRDEIEAFCRRWKITELSVFGSALGADFGPESDVDVMVPFAPDARWSPLDVVAARFDLEDVVGRKVDLVERPGIERSHNRRRRRVILDTARVLYATG